MAKQILAYEDVKKMHPEYPYVLAAIKDIPLWLCKAEEEALETREDELRTSATMLKIVDVRLLQEE